MRATGEQVNTAAHEHLQPHMKSKLARPPNKAGTRTETMIRLAGKRCCFFCECPEEIPQNGINVRWKNSSAADHIKSEPLCYGANGNLITRHCNGTDWSPSLNDLEPCMKVMENFDLTSCPPGYHKISENNTDYCFEIGEPSSWDFPCFKSGGATVITELSNSELESFFSHLNSIRSSRYYWLPAQRVKHFNPVVWVIPGPNWGQEVTSNNTLEIQESMLKNCLLLDARKRIIQTESCQNVHPSLCFYINEAQYPAQCPEGYYPFRFMLDEGTCYGIEYADNIFGLTFNGFLESKCSQPMGNNDNNGLARFIFKKMANMSKLPDHLWCWFESSYAHNGSHVTPRNQSDNDSNIVTEIMIASLEGIINNAGTLSLMNTMSFLPCMACEVEMVYRNPELKLEYDSVEKKLYLTIYFPSGLWKYQGSDIGIQCFSNAMGFVSVIEINSTPFLNVNDVDEYKNSTEYNIDKTVYEIDPITDRSAQYWCEGHTQNFTFLQTKRILVNPRSNKVHVFSLVIQLHVAVNGAQNFSDLLNQVVVNITEIFGAKKVLLMDVLEFTPVELTILTHLHVCIGDGTDEDETDSLVSAYSQLMDIAQKELSNIHVTFVNMSSSTYCLPTTTEDIVTLDWELTLIGRITAPKQFCLQSNGLPVKRTCGGSYLLGSVWEPVDGTCSKNYEASNTTTFLYNVAKRQSPTNCTSRFLTYGLNYVLDDVDIIIPADIFYLSMSLQVVLDVAQKNRSLVEMGDIYNIAWAIDRIMLLDETYLRLSQTLNSTNVIVDSVNDILDMIAQYNDSYDDFKKQHYQLAIEPQFIAQISYPAYNNITGIALVNLNNSNCKSFKDMKVIPLFQNTSLDDILSIEELEIATWVPEIVINTLKHNENYSSLEEETLTTDENDVHIVISVFHNDAIFQEIDLRNHAVNSRIVGVSIPGYISNLEHSVPIIFRNLEHNQQTANYCSYWEFHANSLDATPGYWATDGCFFVDHVRNVTICKCYHLTNFGQLISINQNTNPEKKPDMRHTRALNVITLIGCFLSLTGIVGIWTTAALFQSWRKKPGTKILLHLTTAISLPLIFILIFNLDTSIFLVRYGKYRINDNLKGLCIALGASLHYSILTGFMWMLITAILQFIRYVRVLGVRRPSRFMVKFTLIGWGIPLIPVTAVLVANKENYVPELSSVTYSAYNKPICYPTGYFFIYAVVVPVTAILIINVVLFCLVMYSISRGPDGKLRSTDLDLIGAQLRLSILLFFLMGLTWFFGIFSFSSNLISSYLFCLTSTLQGFVLFIYFVICDPATRGLWITLMRPQFFTSSRDSITSLS